MFGNIIHNFSKWEHEEEILEKIHITKEDVFSMFYDGMRIMMFLLIFVLTVLWSNLELKEIRKEKVSPIINNAKIIQQNSGINTVHK